MSELGPWDVAHLARYERGCLDTIRRAAAIESLYSTIVHDPRDWSIDGNDAWIYGIVVGWDDSLYHIAEMHGWSREVADRLARLHASLVTVEPKSG